MKSTIIFASIGLAASCLPLGILAYAGSMENDAQAIQTAKISLGRAVALAEERVAGKAVRAEFERHDRQWFYDVEVAGATQVMDVRIDPENGKVLYVRADKADHDEHDNSGKEDGHEHERE